MSDTIDINVNKIVETIDVFANFEHPNIEINTIESVDNVEVNATPNVVQININSISGDVEWGEIEGILSNQTDLQNALDLKANASDLGDVAFSNDYNDLDNLPTIPNNLEELHNVTETNYTTPIDADSVLTFDITNSLWKRLSWANIKSNLKTYFDTIYQTALGFTPENVANKANDLTSSDNTKYPTTLAVSTALNGKQDTLTNPITGSGANGQVAFFNGTTTQTGDNDLFWDNTNKRLGIGNTTPLESFHVNGSVLSRTSNPLFIMRDTDLDNNALYLGANFGFASGVISYGTFAINRNPANGVFFNTNRASAQINLESSNNNGSIGFYTSVTNNTTPLERMRINGNGNIGIGAISPQARLDVRAQGALSTDIAFRVRNSADTADLFSVNGIGNIQAGSIQAGNIQAQYNLYSRFDVGAGVIGAIVSSAIMEARSTTKGFLPPRMTTTQRDAIATPAAGLIVYDTTENKHYGYNGTTWNAFY